MIDDRPRPGARRRGGTATAVTVNRRDRVDWRAGMTVRDLLAAMRYTFPHIIVAIDGELVPHDAYDETEVPPGADVRVTHLMAGG
jgi:thiamine biosynthesis protein ThiS